MFPEQQNGRQVSLKTFRQARAKAKLAKLTSKVKGKETKLIPFDVVRQNLRGRNPQYQGVVEIPLNQIVGSMGRYDDFTREFLPLSDNIKERWVGVQSLASSMQGWPPIEVFKVGEAYFVKDGNHRTAVAKQMGNKMIEAHVWEYPADLPIESTADLNDVLLQMGKSRFLDETQIELLIPNHGIEMTNAGRYPEFLIQIENLRQKLSGIDGEEWAFVDTVPFWYEMMYQPTVQIIQESGMLDHFAGRTEADLFGWLSRHRYELSDQYGEYENLLDLVEILIQKYEESPMNKASRQFRNLLGGDELPPLEDA